MTRLQRGIAVAVLHVLMVACVAGKYLVDRQRLPRAWALVMPVDPNLPIRGRYVRLQVVVDTPPGLDSRLFEATLAVEDGRLVARPAPAAATIRTTPVTPLGNLAVLRDPVAFYLSEHVQDPSLLAASEELWAEVSVPASGPPRPIRLGVKRNGMLRPLDLQ
jgi:hypothetical protein